MEKYTTLILHATPESLATTASLIQMLPKEAKEPISSEGNPKITETICLLRKRGVKLPPISKGSPTDKKTTTNYPTQENVSKKFL